MIIFEDEFYIIDLDKETELMTVYYRTTDNISVVAGVYDTLEDTFDLVLHLTNIIKGEKQCH